jgi:hypothetical protein
VSPVHFGGSFRRFAGDWRRDHLAERFERGRFRLEENALARNPALLRFWGINQACVQACLTVSAAEES